MTHDFAGLPQRLADRREWPRARATSRERMGLAWRIAVALLAPLNRLVTRRDWHGREQVAHDGGVLVVGNHISDADPLVLGYFLYESGRLPRFMAKQVLFNAPLLGRALRLIAQIPVDRRTPRAGLALGEAFAALEAGEMVVMFPEGRETLDPAYWPEAGTHGAALLALEAGVPVVPVAQWGTQGIRGHETALHLWPRTTVHVLAGNPVDLSPWLDRDRDEETLAEVTRVIMDRVQELVAQLRDDGARPPLHRARLTESVGGSS